MPCLVSSTGSSGPISKQVVYKRHWDERTNTSPSRLLYTGMTLDPNNACAEVARYLLGVGAVPPPTPQDLVLARLHGALDGGALEHPLHGMQIFVFRLHPLENPGPVQGARPPIGGHGGTQAAAQLDDQY
jgi:hypothetical protein